MQRSTNGRTETISHLATYQMIVKGERIDNLGVDISELGNAMLSLNKLSQFCAMVLENSAGKDFGFREGDRHWSKQRKYVQTRLLESNPGSLDLLFGLLPNAHLFNSLVQNDLARDFILGVSASMFASIALAAKKDWRPFASRRGIPESAVRGSAVHASESITRLVKAVGQEGGVEHLEFRMHEDADSTDVELVIDRTGRTNIMDFYRNFQKSDETIIGTLSELDLLKRKAELKGTCPTHPVVDIGSV
jgi:hypothetical protein